MRAMRGAALVRLRPPKAGSGRVATARPGSLDRVASPATYNDPIPAARRCPTMSHLQDLADRVERLVLRHEELKRASALLEQQLGAVVSERDSLKSRLAAARARIDTLLTRLPAEEGRAPQADGSIAP